MTLDIALLSTYPPAACGIASYCEYLANALVELGHRVTVLAEIDGPGKPEKVYKDGIPICKCWYRTRPLANIARLLRSSAKLPNVLWIQHEFGIFPNNLDLWDFMLDIQQHMTVALTLHTVLSTPKQIGFFRAPPFVPKTFVHSYAAALALKAWHPAWEPIMVPHGVKVVNRQLKPPGTDRPIVGLVPGFISPSKAHIDILHGLALALTIQPCVRNVSLRIAGEYKHHDYVMEIQQTIASLGLQEFVKLDLGFQEDLGFADADYLILGAQMDTRSPEQGPYSASGQIADAIAYGLPVLARNVPIYNTNAPNVIHWNTKEELANLLVGLLRDDNQRRLIGASVGPEFVTTRSWKHVAELQSAALL